MKAGKVRQSIRRFHDYSRDLIYSDMNNFEDRLALLLDFIVRDELFTDIHNQLLNNPNVDYDSWHKDRRATERGMSGSGTLAFPTNTDDRLSIMYKTLIKVGNKEMEVFNFARPFYATSSPRFDDYIRFFNENITEPLMREIGYKLEDIELELPLDDRKEVTAPMVQIIHNAQNVIQQNISGNNNNQTAAITDNDGELDKLFIDLKEEISKLDISPEEKQDSLETVSYCEEMIKAEKPLTKAAKKLLSTIPPLGNVASIVSAIMACVAM